MSFHEKALPSPTPRTFTFRQIKMIFFSLFFCCLPGWWLLWWSVLQSSENIQYALFGIYRLRRCSPQHPSQCTKRWVCFHSLPSQGRDRNALSCLPQWGKSLHACSQHANCSAHIKSNADFCGGYGKLFSLITIASIKTLWGEFKFYGIVPSIHLITHKSEGKHVFKLLLLG